MRNRLYFLKWIIIVISVVISAFLFLMAGKYAWLSSTPVKNVNYFIKISKNYYFYSISVFIIGIVLFIGITIYQKRSVKYRNSD